MPVLYLSQAVDRVRLAVADWNDPVILPDETIEYVLSKNNNNESAAIRECAMYILGTFVYDTRQRIDRIEFFGGKFENYLTYLQKTINNPAYFQIAGIYAGGVDVAEFNTNVADSTTVQKQIPSYDNYREPDYDNLIG